jgi:PAS domain S-box-containing protein
MKIKTKLQIIIIINIMILVGNISLNLLWQTQADKQLKQQAIIMELNQVIFEQARIREEYFLYREDRSKEQFLLIHKKIAELLERMLGVFTQPEEKVYINNIIGYHKNVGDLFSQLPRVDQKAAFHPAVIQELRERIISQMLVNAHSMHQEGLKLLKTAGGKIAHQNDLVRLYSNIAFGLLALFIASFAWVIIRTIAGPLKSLQKGTEIIAGGNLDYKTNIRTSDEIGKLSNAFDGMTENLKNITVSRNELNHEIKIRKQVEEVLREERQRLTGIIKGTNVGTWEWNVQTGETIFNDRWAEIIGYTLDEISPVSIETWMKFAHPDDLKASGELLEQYFRGELDYYEFESRMKHKVGSWVWVLDRGKVTSWTEDGKPQMMMGTHQDITERKRIEEKLRESEVQYRSLFECMLDGFAYCKMLYDGQNRPVDFVYLNVNKAFNQLTGLKNVVGKKATEAITGIKELNPEIFDIYGRVALTGKPERFEIDFKPLAKQLFISVYSPVKGYFVAVFEDITERKRVDEELRSSTKDLRESQRIAHLGNWRLSLATNQVVWSEELYKMYGFDPALPPPPYTEHMNLFTPVRWERLSTALANTRETGIPYELELETLRIDGSNGWMWVRGETEVDSEGKTVGLWGAAQDITAHKQAEEKIRAALLEKETMLKEIHHRVKNNLQVISSLLDLQSSYLQDEKAREMLQNSIDRVRTMAQIHTMLYQSADLALVDFGGFIRDLAGRLQQSYGTAGSSIEVHTDIGAVSLTIETSIPCGLILNELVANSLKHAFPKGSEGRIDIGMKCEGSQCILKIQDNGIGFPASIDFRKMQTLGLELVNLLVGQMNGKIDMQVDDGTIWTIIFPIKNEREWQDE